MTVPHNVKSQPLGFLHSCARVAGLLFCSIVMILPASVWAQEPLLVAICQIQGKGFSAQDWLGQFVYVAGVVSADFDLRRGLIAIQQPDCDSDPQTSDGIWIHLTQKADIVRKGDYIRVGGTVQETYHRTEIASETHRIEILSSDNPLPPSAELLPPQNDAQSQRYFEAYEGMLVSVSSANVLGPTDSYETTWLMPAEMEVTRLFYDDLRGTGGVFAIDDGGDYQLVPALKVGDRVENIVGVLDEAYEAYRIYLLAEPIISEAPFWGYPQAPPTSGINTFRLATFNLANLFDTQDDPNVNDSLLSKTEYQRRLRKRAHVLHEVLGEADIVAIQEAENENVLHDLIIQPEITTTYEIIWEDTPDLRGLDVALLYRKDRLCVTDVRQEQGCTDLVDGLGPDGNQDVHYPKNTPTCDYDGDGTADGNRLFLRPPLVVKLELTTFQRGTAPAQLIVIVNHWKSKVEDSPWTLYTLPRRWEEAKFTAQLIHRLRAEFPDIPIILAGDLNDFPTSLPLQTLRASGIIDLTQIAETDQRYSYVYRGVSQNVDYLFLDPGKGLNASQVTPLHLNADYPYPWTERDDTPIRASDHDLWQAVFYFPYQNYLPLTIRGSH
ncbi:MAG: ExeM/NucH family extracellular endonuclease [Anaerolineales bacterium]